MTYDVAAQKLVEKPVLRVFRHAPQRFGVLGGTSLAGVTPNHPIFEASSGVFLRADQLAEGQRLLRLVGGDLQQSPSGVFRPSASNAQPVYNLTIEDTETYFADGVLVHNKSPAPPESCEIYSYAYGPGCEDTVILGGPEPLDVYSAEAACGLVVAAGSGGGAGQAQPLNPDLSCPLPDTALSKLPRDILLKVMEGDAPERECEGSTLVISNLSGPVHVEFFVRMGEDCTAPGERLVSQLIAGEEGSVPLPDHGGNLVLKLTPQDSEPLTATVSLH